MSPAFMTPVFSNNMPIMGQPANGDKFWYLERRYSDRSGWDEITVEAQTAADEDANAMHIEVNRLHLDGEEAGVAVSEVDTSESDSDYENECI